MPKNPTDHQPPKKTKQYGFGGAPTVDLDLPSGHVVQVQTPNPERLIAAGLLDEFDGFTAVVAGETVPKAQAAPDEPAVRPKTDLKTVARQLAAMNRIVAQVVIQPRVVMEEEDAVDGAVWVNDPTVSIGDKTFIVQHATTGTTDLAAFRAGPAGALVGVPAGT